MCVYVWGGGRAVGKGDVMGFFVTATEDRKGRNSGVEEKKRPPILRKFLVPVASQKYCWEDNVTEAALHPIISVTGREEILEHVLILTGLGGGERSAATPETRLYKMTFHFYPPRATTHTRLDVQRTRDGGGGQMYKRPRRSVRGGCVCIGPLSAADVTSALPQRRHSPVSLCGDDISALTFISVRFSGECARSFGGKPPSDWTAVAPGRGRRATAVTSSMI